MKALVVYDSIFGNTEKIAKAVRDALGKKGLAVEALRPAETDPGCLKEVDLLVVGSPTRGFRPTPAVRKFLEALPARGLEGVRTAAFDTGIALEDVDSKVGRFFMNAFGYAAAPIAKRLARKGGRPVVPPEGFFVTGSEGPLAQGELERAGRWGEEISKRMRP